MLEEFIFDDENDEKKSFKNADRRMMMFSSHTFHVSQGDRHRFPTSQFGYRFSTTCSPYLLQDFSQVLQRYTTLEAYCDAVDECSPSTDRMNGGVQGEEPDLFQALFFPQSIAPRTSMKSVAATRMTENTLSAMWFRLVAHYFEWLAGISELQYLNDQDKLRLAVCQLCNVICLSVLYANYQSKGETDFLFFGSGYYWDPATSNDPLMNEYCQALNRSINQILPPFRKVKMTREEFILTKLIVLFDCTNLIGISEAGLEFSRSMCNKYRTTLSEYVRHRAEEMAVVENWTDEEVDKFSVERMRSLVDMPIIIEKLGKIDDESLAILVESNYGGMRGTLQQQIHTESKKTKRVL